MAPKMLKRDEEPDEAVEVNWEDQSRINTFSKLNTRLSEVEDQLKRKLEEKEALDDLALELELADEDEPVLYKLGDSFFHMPLPRALKTLEKDTEAMETKMNELRAKKRECESGMSELKVLLYAKFGTQINLETNPDQ
ncbi:Molecular chaperone Prefoldin, subunit 4 [Phaffia rhodozyma]|uniref:Prefoldin subunit 4 n=1 Tax=Phaffia rhodozyma TaxID=264483 RepID=A0A0F7SMZ6_PHARH|nr:Molecular chaperone Prefoldin, subunit 4 [Phaffia rhodozyma]